MLEEQAHAGRTDSLPLLVLLLHRDHARNVTFEANRPEYPARIETFLLPGDGAFVARNRRQESGYGTFTLSEYQALSVCAQEKDLMQMFSTDFAVQPREVQLDNERISNCRVKPNMHQM